MKLPPGTVVDRYTVEAVLGEGGMAVVYRARHNQLGSLHAMKVLKLPTAAIQDRLLQEGRAQAQLRHPNIVSVTDVVDVSGSPGLVMEFIAGIALDDFLRTRKLTIEQADDLARGIIEGVAVAHQAGMIHRDLKPGNILLDPTAKRPVPKITDFGLAKLLDVGSGGLTQTETRSGMAMGTPAYMAPEQIESAKDVDKRADVFSLGAILYELVGGERPFQGDSTLEVLNAVAAGKRRPIEELVPDVPDRIRIAIDGALQVDRDERIANCDALLDVWTGESDGRAVGPWDPDTVSQIGRAMAPIQPGSHSDDSDTYYPTQGAVEASQPPPSVLEEVAPTPAPPPEPPQSAMAAGPAWIAAGVGGVAAVLAIVGFATMGAANPNPRAPGPTVTPVQEVAEALGPELPPEGGDIDVDGPEDEGEPSVEKVAAAPDPEPAGASDAGDDAEADEADDGETVATDAYDPDMPTVDFLSVPVGATVKIDGLEVGTTPLRGYQMPKGRYKVQMALEGAEITEKVSVGGKRGARKFTWTVEGGSWAQD